MRHLHVASGRAVFFENWVSFVRIPALEPVLAPLRDFKPLNAAEYYMQDALARYFGRRAKIHPELVYLAIDRDSITLDQFAPEEVEASPALQLMKKGWPWSRSVYPLIIQRLVDAGAKVVVMDLMFPTQRENDDVFRAALDKYHDKVIFGVNFVQASRDNGGSDTLQFPTDELVPATSPIDDRLAYVNFWPDTDGVIRHVYYSRTTSEIFHDPPETGEEVYDSLSARTLRKSGNASLIPAPGPHRIRFAGPAGTFQIKSVCDLFDEQKWKSPEYDDGKFFRGKIVLLGPEGNFMKDTVRTPFGTMGGPEMHLNAMNAALDHDFIGETSASWNYALIATGGIVAWVLCVRFRSPLVRLAVIIFAVAAWIVIAQELFNPASLLVFTFNPLVSLFSSGICCLSWDFFMEQKEKARVRGTLERYVSKHAVREIIDNPSSYFNTLGGVRKPVAIFFSDLRGFTSMTEEAADSHAVITQLNEYFDVMVQPILANRGCLDKLIGDAIMAVWGNIQSRGPALDVRDAVVSALKMRESLPKLNEQWVAAGKKPLAMGMGINHGEVIVGNLGSKQQMNFTVIGDTVNLGSRIEGTTKEYGVDLLVGEDAAKLVKDDFLMQTAGLTQVKGRKKPVELFYVIGERPAVIEPRQEEYMRIYGEGMALYIKGDFTAAGEKFKRSLELHPPDALAKVYIERCSIMAKDPVPAGWNGVFVMKGK